MPVGGGGGGGGGGGVVAHFVQLLSIHRSMMYVQLRLNTIEYHRCGAVDIATRMILSRT
jgi:hypothetical protein